MKAKRTMRTVSVVLATIFAASMMLFSSCNSLSREDYDPLIVDEEACRELAKISTCLEYFEGLNYIMPYEAGVEAQEKDFVCKYIRTILPNFTTKNFNEIPETEMNQGIDVIYMMTQETRVALVQAALEYYGYCNEALINETPDFAKGKELIFTQIGIKNGMYSKLEQFALWSKNQYKRLEYLLYKQSGLEILPDYEMGGWEEIEIENKEEFEAYLDELVLEHYKTLNAAPIDYSALTNDDNAQYQIWDISKKADASGIDAIGIVVVYDENGDREYLMLNK